MRGIRSIRLLILSVLPPVSEDLSFVRLWRSNIPWCEASCIWNSIVLDFFFSLFYLIRGAFFNILCSITNLYDYFYKYLVYVFSQGRLHQVLVLKQKLVDSVGTESQRKHYWLKPLEAVKGVKPPWVAFKRLPNKAGFIQSPFGAAGFECDADLCVVRILIQKIRAKRDQTRLLCVDPPISAVCRQSRRLREWHISCYPLNSIEISETTNILTCCASRL